MVAACVLAACCGDEDTLHLADGPEPGAKNQRWPVFVRPFEGQYRNSNPFDHKYPQGRNDDNQDFITFQGYNIEPGWDGHNGHDWVMANGTPLRSVADGEVTVAGSETCSWAPERANGDNLVVRIQHTLANGEVLESLYAHLSEFRVSVGDRVRAGQVIGLSGDTGCATGPHLHFSVSRITSTNSGEPSFIDPFGWEADFDDPWALHEDGAVSQWLWKPGEAPSISNYPDVPR